MMKGTMEGDVFRLAELVMDEEGENAGEWELVERGSTSKLCRGKLFLYGARGDEDESNLGTMVAEYGEITLVSWCRDAREYSSDRQRRRAGYNKALLAGRSCSGRCGRHHGWWRLERRHQDGHRVH
jgi:hypothetical protein